MRIELPSPSLILLVGPSGCGKSSFARKHFLPTEVVSSDACRGVVSDDENSQEATHDAFELLHFVVRKRLQLGRLTVVDATNVQPESRKALIKIAHDHHLLVTAIVFLLPAEVCHERNALRPDRQFGEHVVRNQLRDLRRSLGNIQREGVRYMHVLRTVEDVDGVEIGRTPLWTNRQEETGPFDVIGDVHGCYAELTELLENLGYGLKGGELTPPKGRKLIFLGDLVDRGPDSPAVLRLVMNAVERGQALCIPGNHDDKLLRKLNGKDVRVAHGLEKTLEQLEGEPPEFHESVKVFLKTLVSHYLLDEGRLVVAHAGMKEEMQGRSSAAVRDFALYGETTGEVDEFGLPIRMNWAMEYRGKARVVYGHTPVPEAEWLNRTINIDTGCVFGGKLTALRYPELELVSVPAHHTYAESARPFLEDGRRAAQHLMDDVLDLEDISGKRIVHTKLRGNITIREENATAAIETMSRFAADPKWLIYLPPTMSPTETSSLPGLLEHPAEAFAYFRHEGVPQVICEEKHMGSRAVVVICRNSEVAAKRFGVESGEAGIVYTRTGRRFFEDPSLEIELLERVRSASSHLWETLDTDWMVLDCELMPWSAKAQELLRRQYAPVGAASTAATSAALDVLQSSPTAEGLVEKMTSRKASAESYVAAYRRYCWPVNSIDDLKLAPFHLLASEGAVHMDKDHRWHMETLSEMCTGDPLLLSTPFRVVEVMDSASVDSAIQWWEVLTGSGGEGMVVKPLSYVAQGPKGLVQPAVKCRGREYLRIIYGPEYTLPENLERLRKRGLGVKRSLAMREFALGMEGLQRFVAGEPLRLVHECAFAVLALESEPVDPRL